MHFVTVSPSARHVFSQHKNKNKPLSPLKVFKGREICPFISILSFFLCLVGKSEKGFEKMFLKKSGPARTYIILGPV